MNRALPLGVATLTLIVGLAACAPEPVSTPDGASTPPAATPTPFPTATATTAPVVLPATCEDLYPTDLAARLGSELPPLNDPGLEGLLSTENTAALTLLDEAGTALRCTWGAPGTPGLATTLAVVDADQETILQDALDGSGFGCEPLAGGILCAISQETIDQDDNLRTNGETHWWGGGVWVATHWVDSDPDGYTEGIVSGLTT